MHVLWQMSMKLEVNPFKLLRQVLFLSWNSAIIFIFNALQFEFRPILKSVASSSSFVESVLNTLVNFNACLIHCQDAKLRNKLIFLGQVWNQKSGVRSTL